MRIHHCVADGIALARVMLTLTDGGEPDAGIAPARGPATAASRLPALGAAARLAGSVVHEGVETLLHPGARRHARVGGRRRRADARQAAAARAATRSPRSRASSRSPTASPGRTPSTLWRVKRAGRAHGATVNDVLVTAVAGAVGRHLREFGDDVGEVHALVPFNLRPLDQPLPRELGNRFGLVLLGLPVGIEDPVERLAEVKRRMDAIKHGHEGVFASASSA